jgi:hypothetical protein
VVESKHSLNMSLLPNFVSLVSEVLVKHKVLTLGFMLLLQAILELQFPMLTKHVKDLRNLMWNS